MIKNYGMFLLIWDEDRIDFFGIKPGIVCLYVCVPVNCFTLVLHSEVVKTFKKYWSARAGNLTFMVGGVEQEFDAAKELLICMGSNVVYCGEVGTGQAAKICNNMLLAISMIGTAETMNLGIRLGLDPKLLAKILNMSSGRCWSSDTYNPVPGVMEGVPSANNYQGGFGTTLMAKDLGLAQISATNTKTPVPLGSQAHQIYRMMCAKGYALKDFSAVFQFLREEESL
uniref:3-hydroxyisobutyrate dehydrogenase, mitochondrial n=1 Tax=Meleagris gallopavo TaxID=9103 RepID=A0A803Y5F6_MELGA